MVRRVEQLCVDCKLPPPEGPIFFRAHIEPLIVALPNGVVSADGRRIAGAEDNLPAKVQRGCETVVGKEVQRVSLVRQGRVDGNWRNCCDSKSWSSIGNHARFRRFSEHHTRSSHPPR